MMMICHSYCIKDEIQTCTTCSRNPQLLPSSSKRKGDTDAKTDSKQLVICAMNALTEPMGLKVANTTKYSSWLTYRCWVEVHGVRLVALHGLYSHPHRSVALPIAFKYHLWSISRSLRHEIMKLLWNCPHSEVTSRGVGCCNNPVYFSINLESFWVPLWKYIENSNINYILCKVSAENECCFGDLQTTQQQGCVIFGVRSSNMTHKFTPVPI